MNKIIINGHILIKYKKKSFTFSNPFLNALEILPIKLVSLATIYLKKVMFNVEKET